MAVFATAFFVIGVFASFAAPTSILDTITECSSFKGTFENATVRFATYLPSGSIFIGDSVELTYDVPQTDLPGLCQVGLELQTSNASTARFEVWLPDEWNSRFLTVGNGGWAGGINYPDIAYGVKKGFATMSTDTGHNSTQSDATWTGNPEEMIDFGHRAMHLGVLSSKAVISQYYAVAASFSYYSGCSTGGRQGLQEVQRYPSDFDGALVGAPANWNTHLAAWDIWVALLQFPITSETFIPATMWNTIHAAVLEQCDDIDGAVDGVINDPTKCHFDPEVLSCDLVPIGLCLTADQIVNLKRIYAPWISPDNITIFEGLSPGGEEEYSYLFNGLEPEFGIDFYKNAVLNDSSWDYETMNATTVMIADAINPGGVNAFNPDMRAFQRNGGKVIEYHGYEDPIIPSLASKLWHDKIVDFYASLGQTEEEIADFYRLYMVPGMTHCSGGDGAWVIDASSQEGLEPENNSTQYSALYSLIEWVENSTPPETLIGTKYTADTPALGVEFTRPYCLWTNTPVFSGNGSDVNDATSWVCT